MSPLPLFSKLMRVFCFLPLLDQLIHSFIQQMFLVVKLFHEVPCDQLQKKSSEREQERLRWKGLRVFLHSLSAFLWWVITVWSKVHLPQSITCPQRYKADGNANSITCVIWIWGIIKNFSNSSWFSVSTWVESCFTLFWPKSFEWKPKFVFKEPALELDHKSVSQSESKSHSVRSDSLQPLEFSWPEYWSG